MKTILNRLKALLTPVKNDVQIADVSFENKFISISVNKNLTEGKLMERVLQLEDEQYRNQYVLFAQNNDLHYKSFANDRLVQISTEENLFIQKAYQNKLAQAYEYSLNQAIKLLREESEVQSDLASETRGLEWIKTSLVVLKAAVKEAADHPDKIFESMFFFGKRQDYEDLQLRVHCLSIDILLEFVPDGRLRVMAWNYKNEIPNPKARPTFTGEFVKLRGPVFDEIIELIVEISKASTKLD